MEKRELVVATLRGHSSFVSMNNAFASSCGTIGLVRYFVNACCTAGWKKPEKMPTLTIGTVETVGGSPLITLIVGQGIVGSPALSS